MLAPAGSPLVLSRTVDADDSRKRADAAVMGAVEHDAPSIAVAGDLNDGHAMGGHLDLDQFRRHLLEAGRVLAPDAREHDLLVGVFVIDAEESARPALIERDEAHIVVVVAELLQLRRGTLRAWIEGRRIGEQRIAPAEQHLRVVAGSQMMRLVDARLDFREAEAILGYLRPGGTARKRCGPEQDCGGDDPEAAADHGAAAITPQDDVADGLPIFGAQRHIVIGLVGLSPVAETVVFRHMRDLASVCGSATLEPPRDTIAKRNLKMAAETPICDFGWKAPPFALPSVDGKSWSLDELRGPNGTLVMFICNHCPYVKAVIDRVVRDVNELRAPGIRAVAICSNDATTYPDDSFANMGAFAKEHGFTFPYLHDETQEMARAYGAICTPDFFGFNDKLELHYRGRLDASGRDAAPPGAPRELFEAMKEIAATGQGPRQQTPSIGCSIKWKAA
jgi:peroxiredoxin